MILLALLVLAHDKTPAKPPPSGQCGADGDCIISTFAGCCGACCPREPYAVSRESAAAEKRRCAVIDCAAPRCADVQCIIPPPASAFRAVCKAGRCQAVPAPGDSGCVGDGDCRLEWDISGTDCASSPCGCCQGVGAPMAVPARAPSRQPPAPPGAPRPLAKKDEKTPPFGLSPGTGAPAAPVVCPPCPPARQARAICEERRCVVSESNNSPE